MQFTCEYLFRTSALAYALLFAQIAVAADTANCARQMKPDE